MLSTSNGIAHPLSSEGGSEVPREPPVHSAGFLNVTLSTMDSATSKKGLHAKEVATPHSEPENFVFSLSQAGITCSDKFSYSALESNLLFYFVHYSTFIVFNIMDHLLKLPVRDKN